MASVIQLPCAIKDTSGNWTREVELDEITGIEEDILADTRMAADGSGLPAKSGSARITEILSRCTIRIGNSVRPEGMDRFTSPKFFEECWWNAYLADRSYSVVQLRRLSLGDDFSFTENCPACKQEIPNISVDLSTLTITEADQEAARKAVHPLELPSGNTFSWRMFTGRDEDKIHSIQRNHQEDMRTALLFLRCVQLNDLTSPVEIQETIRRMGIRDRTTIRNAMSKVEGGIEQDHKITCPHAMCHTQFTLRLDPGKPSFFFPSEI